MNDDLLDKIRGFANWKNIFKSLESLQAGNLSFIRISVIRNFCNSNSLQFEHFYDAQSVRIRVFELSEMGIHECTTPGRLSYISCHINVRIFFPLFIPSFLSVSLLYPLMRSPQHCVMAVHIHSVPLSRDLGFYGRMPILQPAFLHLSEFRAGYSMLILIR